MEGHSLAVSPGSCFLLSLNPRGKPLIEFCLERIKQASVFRCCCWIVVVFFVFETSPCPLTHPVPQLLAADTSRAALPLHAALAP